ncbi:MAG: dienelactone hydrolase family protein [Sphingobium sp.]|nr:dienelactone hydrolase family protein [Sphingobium sp.]
MEAERPMPNTHAATGIAHHYFDGDIELRGEHYRPTVPANGRAVLVVHEADGIGGNVRRHCAMLADLGYTAFAADMHGGGRVLEGAEMEAALKRFRSDPDHLRARVRAGLDALAAVTALDAAQIAAIGFCFGGFAVLELARSGAALRAVASFHGLLTTRRPAERGAVTARIAAFTGAKDPLVPLADVTAFQAEMANADADWLLQVHGQARHSFTNEAVSGLGDPRMRYDPVAHHLSWRAMLGFFDTAFADISHDL